MFTSWKTENNMWRFKKVCPVCRNVITGRAVSVKTGEPVRTEDLSRESGWDWVAESFHCCHYSGTHAMARAV